MEKLLPVSTAQIINGTLDYNEVHGMVTLTIDNAVLVPENDTAIFTYKPDPSMTTIEPLKSILSYVLYIYVDTYNKHTCTR